MRGAFKLAIPMCRLQICTVPPALCHVITLKVQVGSQVLNKQQPSIVFYVSQCGYTINDY